MENLTNVQEEEEEGPLSVTKLIVSFGREFFSKFYF